MNSAITTICIGLVLILITSVECLSGPINIIPRPQSLEPGIGNFQLKSTTTITTDSDLLDLANQLNTILEPSTGFRLTTSTNITNKPHTNCIYLHLTHDSFDNDEAYRLQITKNLVDITAKTPAGILYGLQSLRQLLPPEIDSAKPVNNVNWEIPAVTINDSPRFKWRGLHLDVSRHMFPVSFIKQYIDIMARYKLNTFHFHLTDDQGWRIEIKRYPELTTISSNRSSTPIPSDRDRSDNTPYGGYYSQQEIKDIVAYAADRFITIIPEIEMPGHSIATLAAFPELGCIGGPYKVRTSWGVEPEVFCGGNDKTFEFLENVLDEIITLFPSKIIHIGGDECPKDRWKQCPKCQQRIRDNQLGDEHGLQSYFITRIEKYLNSKDRSIIGWDEILEGGLAPNAMVMSWRGTQGGIDAARSGHYVVMSPTSYCYFDYYQSENHATEPPAIGGLVTLEKVYSYDPVPAELSDQQKKYILGVQANLWTEYIPTPKQAQYMAYPRALALAEVAWTNPQNKSLPDFMQTLNNELKRFDILKINYRKVQK